MNEAAGGFTWLELVDAAIAGLQAMRAELAAQAAARPWNRWGEIEPAPAAAPASAPPEADQTGAAAPEQPAATGAVWTAERNQALLAADGASGASILAALNRMPGTPIKNLAALHAQRAKLKRRAAQGEAAPSPAPAKAAVVTGPILPPATTALTDSGRQVADQDQIRTWAGQRGLCQSFGPLDLPKINATRKRLGFPEFELRQGGRA